jgi:hypothetical protein
LPRFLQRPDVDPCFGGKREIGQPVREIPCDRASPLAPTGRLRCRADSPGSSVARAMSRN